MIDPVNIITALKQPINKKQFIENAYLQRLVDYSIRQETMDKELQEIIQQVSKQGNIKSTLMVIKNLPNLNIKSEMLIYALIKGGIL